MGTTEQARHVAGAKAGQGIHIHQQTPAAALEPGSGPVHAAGGRKQNRGKLARWAKWGTKSQEQVGPPASWCPGVLTPGCLLQQGRWAIIRLQGLSCPRTACTMHHAQGVVKPCMSMPLDAMAAAHEHGRGDRKQDRGKPEGLSRDQVRGNGGPTGLLGSWGPHPGHPAARLKGGHRSAWVPASSCLAQRAHGAAPS